MARLSEMETRDVMDFLRDALDETGRGRALKPYRIAVEAVRGRHRRRAARAGSKGRPTERSEIQKLQRVLARNLVSEDPPKAMREMTFDYLVRYMGQYDAALGKGLLETRRVTSLWEKWDSFSHVATWFAMASVPEYEGRFESAANPRTAASDLNPPDWIRNLIHSFMRDADVAGISLMVAWQAGLRLVAPFCGHARSGGRLPSWQELTPSALKRAVQASVDAERIWLGLDGSMRPGTDPLRFRLSDQMRLRPEFGDGNAG